MLGERDGLQHARILRCENAKDTNGSDNGSNPRDKRAATGAAGNQAVDSSRKRRKNNSAAVEASNSNRVLPDGTCSTDGSPQTAGSLGQSTPENPAETGYKQASMLLAVERFSAA